jgi:uncharacterized protein YdhG (YjbR/CyaY superfamily)
MERKKAGIASIDEYIATYQMPAFDLKGNLVLFAAWKNHIGFYGDFSAIEVLKSEMSVYLNAKGILKFPIDKPLPLKLIHEIATFKVAENLKNAEMKSSKGTS